MLELNECFKCKKVVDELYTTDCTEGFGPADYCADCLIKLAKEGFNDENVICHCGCKMTLMNEEDVLEAVNKDGVLCYTCEPCEGASFVGLYVNQPYEVVDQVWEGKVGEDELEVEYVYDYEYALNYDRNNTVLFGKKYTEDWQELLFIELCVHLIKTGEVDKTTMFGKLQ